MLIYSLAVIILIICWRTARPAEGIRGITGATIAVQPHMGIVEYLQLTVLFIFFLSAFIIQKRPKPWFRYAILIFAVVFLGFYKKTLLSTWHILNFVNGKFWPLTGHIFIYTLFSLILLTALLGKGTYCSYCCPFGAVQQLIYKISPFKQKFNPYLISLFRRFRYLFLWLILAAALLLRNLRIARIDPFTAMFFGKGGLLEWTQLGLILGFSLLYYRIWCFHFCPVGAAVHIAEKIPRLKTVFSKEPVSVKKTAWRSMLREHRTYIFLVVFLLLLVVTLFIIAVNLKRQVHLPVLAPRDTVSRQISSPAEDFIKYGIKPKEAKYYE